MKTLLLLFSLLPSFLGNVALDAASTKSFMSDKTEVPVNLEVSGAEAISQTEDGFVWIGQYSGLTRYDSKEFVTYKSFVEDGVEHSVINVKALASKGTTLYVATTEEVFVHQNYEFSCLKADFGIIKDIVLDEANDLLYVSSVDKGATIYDVKNNTSTKLVDGKDVTVNDIALDTKRDNIYYQLNAGVYDKTGKEIYLYPKILDIYTYDDILYIGQENGVIQRYNMATSSFLDEILAPDQVNKMLYSESDKALYLACDKKGLYCVELSGAEPIIVSAGDLVNGSQLVDLMIDYEGNLWIVSHSNAASGVSIITKDALAELLHDDEVWKKLSEQKIDKTIFAIERYGDILYLVSATRILLYDLKQNKILPDNILMQTLEAYAEEKAAIIPGFTLDPKDVEIYKGKLYFAVSKTGLVEYDPSLEKVTIYDLDYISGHIDKMVGNPELQVAVNTRSLRSFDNYLAIGYARGLMKFDGVNFSVMPFDSNVLFINKSKEGKLIFCRSSGLYEVDDEFTKATEIPVAPGISGSRLKFLIDGDYIYQTVNSRLFRVEQKNGEYVSTEITVPFVKGSLVELSKIEYKNKNGEINYKYVIASENQIYVADSLDGERLENYEFYDSTNGISQIKANTSGFYDKEGQKYYFQSTNGIYVYDFNLTRGTSVPVKVGVSSVELDGKEFFGNTINISKDIYRVTLNVSVFGFRPNKGYEVYYKMDGIDSEYHLINDNNRSINYTNLPGGEYTFHTYAIDEFGQISNKVDIKLVKELKIHEYVWFWILVGILSFAAIVGITFIIIRSRTKQALKKQLEYKNITVESIQAIARTIDAKDEYTNGHSTRVGHYSKVIAENLNMSQDEVDNIYYIALLHDIGKIAIPDKILNKPGRLTDGEFAVMKSHTVRGANILKGISTIPQIAEGAKSHHEKYDGTGYPEGLKGENIPFVARIICCADCFDAMASKRVYKEPFSLETIINEFKRCAGTQFDPKIAELVVKLIEDGKLKPFSAENTYLGEDGKTHRISKSATENGN